MAAASGQYISVEPSLRARVRASAPDAFAMLFDQHAQAVYRYAAGLTGNWSAAENVVSLTFLEAWRLRQTVTPDGGSLRPWLLGIAVNVTRNQARAARRHRAAMSRLPPPPSLPDFADELTGRLDDRDRLAAVRAAVRGLPPRERDVLICVWSGLSSAEAAQAPGVPEAPCGPACRGHAAACGRSPITPGRRPGGAKTTAASQKTSSSRARSAQHRRKRHENPP